MKLHSLLLLSHAVAAAVVGLPLIAVSLIGGWFLWIVLMVVALGAVGAASLILSWRLQAGLETLEFVVVNHGGTGDPKTGIREFDECAERLGEYAVRWDEVAAASQEQSRDMLALLTLLDRRVGEPTVTSSQLRQVLSGIGRALGRNLDQIEQHAGEIERCTEQISAGAETQSNAVIKTGAYVEQLSANIDSVSNNADFIHQAVLATRESAGKAMKLVADLTEGIDRIRVQSEASEKKLRGLGDHSRQVSSIVEAIGDVAARTELLALNASIESVRAGEHGRGFAVVADEIRKLAEQATQATREIAGIVESMQLETQESIAAIAQERHEVETEVSLVGVAGNVLDKIHRGADDQAARASEIALAAGQQLQLAQDVVLAVEQISEVAKVSRGRAENACWTTKVLAKTTRQFDSSLDRLRRCDETARDDVPVAAAAMEGAIEAALDKADMDMEHELAEV